MKQRSMRKRSALLAVFALIAQMLVLFFGTSSPASAITWPVSYDDIYPTKIYTHGDGSLSLTECSDYGQSYTNKAVKTISPTGLITNDLSRVSTYPDWKVNACGHTTAVANDGTIYVMNLRTTSSGNGEYKVAAYKNNVQLWSQAVGLCTSGNPDSRPNWLNVGYDGDVYAVMEGGNCSGGVTQPDVLAGFNSDDGSLKFTPISLNQNMYNGQYQWPRLSAYPGGLVVVDNNTVRYFNYDGTTTGVPADYTFSLASGEYFDSISINADGRVFVIVQKTGQTGCNAKALRVDWHDPDGTSGSVDVSSYCMYAFLRTMPGSDFLLHDTSESTGKILRFSSSGSLIYQKNLAPITGYWSLWSARTQVDNNGNVVVMRSAIEQTGGSDRHTFVDVIDNSGTMTRVFDTLPLDTSTNNESFRYTHPNNHETIGMADDTLYVPICKYPCSASNLAQIYKVSVSGLGMDYPRSEVIAVQSGEDGYVALGDSFSSGHGVEPFIYNTGLGGNQCYRSEKAYSIVLDQDSSVGLDLKAFVACSGAETQHVDDTSFNGEGPQVEAIGAGTDIVTVTIGGNDVDFAGYGTACKNSDCESGTTAYNTIMGKIENDLPSKLDNVYGAVADKLDSVAPNATVLVVGYPFVIRDHGVLTPCSLGGITQAEQQAAEDVAIALNEEIAAAVIRMGQGNDSRFHFVDALLSTSPFTGHDLCTTLAADRFFNITDAHPNEEGQEAYATLVEDYLASMS